MFGVAQALHEHHPHYYFIIDRDHQEDEIVESSWRELSRPYQLESLDMETSRIGKLLSRPQLQSCIEVA